MTKNFSLDEIILIENEIALKWNDNKETYISLITLRDQCPCAFCSGEKGRLKNAPRRALLTARQLYDLRGPTPGGGETRNR